MELSRESPVLLPSREVDVIPATRLQSNGETFSDGSSLRPQPNSETVSDGSSLRRKAPGQAPGKLTDDIAMQVQKLLGQRSKSREDFLLHLPCSADESLALKKEYFRAGALRFPATLRPRGNSLRIVSFNVQFWANVDGGAAWEDFLAFLVSVDADVLCLQEVVNTPNELCSPKEFPTLAGSSTEWMYGPGFGGKYGQSRLRLDQLRHGGLQYETVEELLRAMGHVAHFFQGGGHMESFCGHYGIMLVLPPGSRASLAEPPRAVPRLAPRWYGKMLKDLRSKHLSNKNALVARLRVGDRLLTLACTHLAEDGETMRLAQLKTLLAEMGAVEQPSERADFCSAPLDAEVTRACLEEVDMVGAFRDTCFCSPAAVADSGDLTDAAWHRALERQVDEAVSKPEWFRNMPEADYRAMLRRKLDPWSQEELSRFSQRLSLSGQRLDPSEPVVLLGDFNSKRRADYSDEQWPRLFGEKLTLVTDYIAQAGLVESPAPLPFTTWGGSRVDFVFASPAMGPGNWEVLPLSFSDHYAVQAEFPL